jgi:malonate decarboxylase gamma subunit
VTLDDVLDGLFPDGHAISRRGHVVRGHGPLADGKGDIAVIGIVDGVELAPADIVQMGEHVLDVLDRGHAQPILVLVDTKGQEMARHAEMIGLNEYCAHLAKCLLLASLRGHRTIGFLYGKAAAGAFLATALATDVLVAVHGAEPAVMDLPSMARVTKLPEKKLAEMAKTMPVFAPGVDPLYQTGAVREVWDAKAPLSAQLLTTLAATNGVDDRGRWGKERGGRAISDDLVVRVMQAAGAA